MKNSGSSLEYRDQRPQESVALTTQHPYTRKSWLNNDRGSLGGIVLLLAKSYVVCISFVCFVKRKRR
jgi:hypothetical protein